MAEIYDPNDANSPNDPNAVNSAQEPKDVDSTNDPSAVNSAQEPKDVDSANDPNAVKSEELVLGSPADLRRRRRHIDSVHVNTEPSVLERVAAFEDKVHPYRHGVNVAASGGANVQQGYGNPVELPIGPTTDPVQKTGPALKPVATPQSVTSETPAVAAPFEPARPTVSSQPTLAKTPAPALTPTLQPKPSAFLGAASKTPTPAPKQSFDLVAPSIAPVPRPSARKDDEEDIAARQLNSAFMYRASLLIIGFGYGFTQGQRPGATQVVTGFAVMMAVTQLDIHVGADGSYVMRHQHAAMYADSQGRFAANRSESLIAGDRNGFVAAHHAAGVSGQTHPSMLFDPAKGLQSPLSMSPPMPGSATSKRGEDEERPTVPTIPTMRR